MDFSITMSLALPCSYAFFKITSIDSVHVLFACVLTSRGECAAEPLSSAHLYLLSFILLIARECDRDPMKYADIFYSPNSPQVVSVHGALDMEMGYIQQTLPKPANLPSSSDTEGLNLNITVPSAGTPKPPDGFPVLAFIHGGALSVGANWWPQYDFKRLVKFGSETGRPFIGVNIG